MSQNVKSAIVTGGSRGIGAAICRELADRGHRVVVNCRKSSETAEDLVKQIEAAGGTAVAHAADVTVAAEARGLIARAVSEFGGLDVLVCNANIGLGQGPVSSVEWETFSTKVQDELAAAFHPTQAALPELAASGRGRIVYISSEGARGPANPAMAAHSTAKAALNAYARFVAKEAIAQGTRVNTLSPGLVRTEASAVLPPEVWDQMISRIPAGRAGTPEDVARAVALLVGDETDYFIGQLFSLNGGSDLGR